MKSILLREVWEVILGNVDDTKDLKSLSLVCRMFKDILLQKLWNYPKLKHGIQIDDLLRLKHLPIKAIDSYDFGKIPGERRGSNVDKWFETVCSFSQLTSLKLGGNIHLNFTSIGKLVGLKNLKSLILEKLYAGVSKAIAQLESMQLETLIIEDLIFYSDIEPISQSVGKISTLKKLEIQTSDYGCLSLSRLPNLEELVIRESEVSVVGLIELAKIKPLKVLKFSYCENIQENIGNFKTLNPAVNVEIEGEDMYLGEDETPPYSDEEYCDYDESDLPPDFFDYYNELHV